MIVLLHPVYLVDHIHKLFLHNCRLLLGFVESACQSLNLLPVLYFLGSQLTESVGVVSDTQYCAVGADAGLT
jgi:hypothetical protein